MSHNNISIFVPHAGCPQQCSFCNQKTISGQQYAPTAKDVKKTCSLAMERIKDKSNTEIAFFGGSFTAIDRKYMLELLTAAKEFLGEGKFKGIRISTRPDFINREILDILKSYGVTSIELGAQSMKNHVLEANNRGHTVEDVYNASSLIKEYGFELGLQMMVGLYKSSYYDETATMKRIIKIKPDTVRIYPVVILAGTRLAELYESGEYKPVSFEKITELCMNMLIEFEQNDIEVIKCGLHASDGVEGDMIGGFYHPAFRELCESLIYRRNMEIEFHKIFLNKPALQVIKARIITKKSGLVFAVEPSCISKAIGHKKSNADYFKKTYNIDIKVVADEKIPKYQCEIRG